MDLGTKYGDVQFQSLFSTECPIQRYIEISEPSEPQLPSPGSTPDQVPESPNTSSSFLDLNPGKLSWFQSPTKKPPAKRVRFTSTERREVSRKRRAECPYVDTTSLLTADERERLWGHDLLYRWSSNPPSRDVLPNSTPTPDSQGDTDTSDEEDLSTPPPTKRQHLWQP